jgi:hypothetical protein
MMSIGLVGEGVGATENSLSKVGDTVGVVGGMMEGDAVGVKEGGDVKMMSIGLVGEGVGATENSLSKVGDTVGARSGSVVIS